MVDRIADIWGQRTPHSKGTVWPTRVDLHLEPGVGVSDVDRWVHSACLLCSNGCGCDIAVKDGRMVGVRGRATDVVNHGRLGPKGLYGSTPWAGSPVVNAERLGLQRPADKLALAQCPRTRPGQVVAQYARFVLRGCAAARQAAAGRYCAAAMDEQPVFSTRVGQVARRQRCDA